MNNPPIDPAPPHTLKSPPTQTPQEESPKMKTLTQTLKLGGGGV